MKKIGLAALAALALTAVLGVAGASASQLNSETYPTTISSSNPYGKHVWDFHTAFQECDAPQLQGSLVEASSNLSSGAKDATCYASYTGYELKMNSCSFVYRPGAKSESGTFKGSVDIACPAGNTISFTGGVNSCKVNVLPQKNLSATYENVGSGKSRAIKVSVTAAALQHSQVSGKDCGGSLGTYSDGYWIGSWKIEGSNGFGSVGIWLSGEGFELPPSGIAVNGATPNLVAGTYPISIAGSQGTQHTLAQQYGNVKCSTANLGSSVSGATAQFSVTPEYSGCSVSGEKFSPIPVTVKTNGCTYTFNVLNQAPSGSTYAGHADIACPAGKAMELVTISAGLVKCTTTIPAQTTDAGGLSFTNEAATSTIGLGLSIAGLDYHQQEGSGLGRCTTGDFTSGTYTGTSTLVGSY